MNKCPNCGRKLSPFYFKPCCPGCGVNLLYFNLSDSLEQDRLKAERENSAVKRFLYGVKLSAIGSAWGVFRIIGAILQIAVPFASVYYMDSSAVQGGFSLTVLIQSLISPPASFSAGSFITALILPNKNLLFGALALILAVLFSIVGAALQLVSYTKNGLRRNFAFSACAMVCFLALSIAAAVNGAVLAGGFYAQVALMAVGLALSAPLEKSVRRRIIAYDSAKTETPAPKSAVGTRE